MGVACISIWPKVQQQRSDIGGFTRGFTRPYPIQVPRPLRFLGRPTSSTPVNPDRAALLTSGNFANEIAPSSIPLGWRARNKELVCLGMRKLIETRSHSRRFDNICNGIFYKQKKNNKKHVPVNACLRTVRSASAA